MKLVTYTLFLIVIFLSSIAISQPDYDEIAFRINEVICQLLSVIFWVIGIIVTLVIIYRGLEYVTTDNPECRNEVKSKIIHAIVALAIIVVAMPVINYLVEGTDILFFKCKPDGYEHPGDCGGCLPDYYTYCCCNDSGSVDFYTGRCSYGVGGSLPVADCGSDCVTMCLGRGYDDGMQEEERCCCYLTTTTVPTTTTV